MHGDRAGRWRSWLGPANLLAATRAGALLAGAMLAVTACGGGSSPTVARIGQTATSAAASAGPSGSSEEQGIAYSRCMRSHGVPGFPDPSPQGYVQLGAGNDVNPDSPQFQQATRICAKLAPVGGPGTQSHFEQLMTSMLKFAACMRAHGITKFPDPVPYGNGGVELLVPNGNGSGVDQNSPQYARADSVCQPLLNGAS
jgi:hypothetical protein